MFIYYLIIINLLSFFLMYLDKRFAIKNKHRISEKTFFIFSFFGGFIGIFLASHLFHHKNIKKSFKLKIIIGAILFIILMYLNHFYAFISVI